MSTLTPRPTKVVLYLQQSKPDVELTIEDLGHFRISRQRAGRAAGREEGRGDRLEGALDLVHGHGDVDFPRFELCGIKRLGDLHSNLPGCLVRFPREL